MKKSYILIILIILFVSKSLPAFELKTYLSSKEVLIGDTILFTAEIDTYFDKMSFNPQSEGITVLDRKIEKEGFRTKFSYLMSIYSIGRFEIPSLEFKLGEKEITSGTIAVYVIPLTTEDDTEILDIKPLWAVRRNLWVYAFVLLAISILALIFVLLLRRMKKKSMKNGYEIAQEQLNKLLKNFNHLYSAGRLKEIALIATHELKRYYSFVLTEELFDLTTDELLKFLKGKIDATFYYGLEEILKRFDLVKFAKYMLDYDTMKKDVLEVINIINKDYKQRFSNVE